MRGDTVQVFGNNLTTQDPDVQVFVGERPATVAARELVLGNDRLRIVVPEDAPEGSAPVSVVRADGVPARDANGVTALAFEVLARPPRLEK